MSEVLETTTTETTTETPKVFSLENLGYESLSEVRSRQKKSFKERVIYSIDTEIELIQRMMEKNEFVLTPKMWKTIDGEKKEMIDFKRFWKESFTQPNKLLVNIKLKGKIFNCGDNRLGDNGKPISHLVDGNGESLIEFLTKVKEGLETVDENNTDFWSF